MSQLLKITAILLIIKGTVCAANYFNFTVDFESDRAGFPPTVAPSTAGQVNTHISSMYQAAAGDSLTVQNGYSDSVTHLSVGSGKVLVCQLSNDTRLYFTIPQADRPTRGSTMKYVVEWEMLVDSALSTYENAGYMVHASNSQYVLAITAGWYAPDGTSTLTIPDYTTSTNKVFYIAGKGVPIKLQMVFDMLSWTVDVYVKGNKLGTFACNPAVSDIAFLQINPYQTVVSTVVFDNFYMGKVAGNCSEQITAGKIMQGDMNQDCTINFKDFAVFAQTWLNCNNAAGVVCP